MATSPQALLDQSKCYICYGAAVEDALELALLAQIAGRSTPAAPAVPGNIDISDASTTGNIIVTWTNSDVPTTNEIWKSTNGVLFVFYASVAGNVHTFSDVAGIGVGAQWYYKVQACNGAANCSAFTAVRSAGRELGSGAASFIFPSLVIHFGDFNINGNAVATTIQWPLCRTITGLLNFNNCTSLLTASFTVLTFVGGQVGGSFCTVLTTVSLPFLVNVNGGASGIFFLNNPVMTTVAFTSLAVTSDIFIRDGGLTALSLPVLTGIVGTFDLSNNPAMTTLDCPAMLALTTGIDCHGSTSLSAVSLPVWIINDFTNINFDNCALVAGVSASGTGVNGMLARGIASGLGVSGGCIFDLANGTNAAPTGQGLTDAADLVTAGNTVNVNP